MEDSTRHSTLRAGDLMLHTCNAPVSVNFVELDGEIYVTIWSGAFGATMTIDAAKKLGTALAEIADLAMQAAIDNGLCVEN